MFLSQKCQYALRALLELTLRHDQGPVKIADIAEEQCIPPRFLEVILGELKRGGFAESRRGKQGGYLLARPPYTMTPGEVIRFVQGPMAPVECAVPEGQPECPLGPDCVFLPMWREARQALEEVFDGRTFQDLAEQHRRRHRAYVPSYTI